MPKFRGKSEAKGLFMFMNTQQQEVLQLHRCGWIRRGIKCGAFAPAQLDTAASCDLRAGACVCTLAAVPLSANLDPLPLVDAGCASLCHGRCGPFALTVPSLSQHVTTAG